VSYLVRHCGCPCPPNMVVTTRLLLTSLQTSTTLFERSSTQRRLIRIPIGMRTSISLPFINPQSHTAAMPGRRRAPGTSSNRASNERPARESTAGTARPKRSRRRDSTASGPSQRRRRTTTSSVILGTDDIETRAPNSRGADEDEIVMAINVRNRNTVGCTYYVARNETMYLMEDCKLGNVHMIDSRRL
jgi:hypothetical protein